ncbi:MAG: hypothetical protein H7196_03120 [candidate division SR1 bacterium]|nr:hypothetical protein [candidate division SR1 bacterium]
MNVKTRLFSLILLAILIIPVFFNPPKSGKVLGISEKIESEPETKATTTNYDTGSVFNSTNTNEQKASNTIDADAKQSQISAEPSQVPEYKLKDISSGIRDKKKKANTPAKESQGKVVWDANSTNSVTSDKFGLGSGIKVKYGNKETNIVVANTRILAPDVLLVVDSKTFMQLGGDLEKQANIDVIISVD